MSYSFRSLHSKIFVLITAILVTVAVMVMMTSQRNVTHTVMAAEHHSIHNVLQLIRHDAASKWAAMLQNKVSIVRNGRHELVQISNIIQTTLEAYAELANNGVITQAEAQRLACEWINQLHFDNDRYAFAFDTQYVVLASGNAAMRGLDLSTLNDYKNRPLARSVLKESRNAGDSFAIYRRPTAMQPPSHGSPPGTTALDTSDKDSRYAYFGYFPPWNWVYAVSDNAATIISETQAHRTQMETAMRETLLPMQLAHSGFVFIIDNDQRLVVPLPGTRASLLDSPAGRGQTLRQRLIQPPHTDLHDVRAIDAGEAWQIDTVYYAPLRWTIVAAVPENGLNAAARKLLYSQILIFAVMLAVALLCAWFVAAHIVQPLKRLTSFVRKLPHYALQSRHRIPPHIAALPDKHKDEVGRLAQAFLYMDSKLRENIGQLMHETARRERFESELNIARTIQQGLLPMPLLPSETRSMDLHAVMRPAKEVGGDLYDYFSLANGKYCVVIGDVSDKGVPAALFMAVTRTLIRAIAEDETNPARMVSKVNERLAENNPNMMFVTLLLGVLDLATGEFAWVNAGHLEPIVIDAQGKVRVLPGRSGPACGVQEGASYRAYRTQLQRGDTLAGYTDGVTESLNRHDDQYGEARMLSVLARPAPSAVELTERLLHDVDTFATGAEQADDITLLVIRRR